ncbi:hypothetical protein [Cyanobium gracile]|uniref:Uncharacterized protein n=1 Tax=Cyanobium gracile UHCC 0281 TaxID=3110309 RepID=A0ABU5SRR0_9CYAN|nr:hypothetical protein [Cyanobium gracile]MEA5441165.1 hypothetical protein [Cyanobium gracile UHCC 0281]
MALASQPGAGIPAATPAPSGQKLIQLGVVAVIRTFLNQFSRAGDRSGATAGVPAWGWGRGATTPITTFFAMASSPRSLMPTLETTLAIVRQPH